MKAVKRISLLSSHISARGPLITALSKRNYFLFNSNRCWHSLNARNRCNVFFQRARCSATSGSQSPQNPNEPPSSQKEKPKAFYAAIGGAITLITLLMVGYIKKFYFGLNQKEEEAKKSDDRNYQKFLTQLDIHSPKIRYKIDRPQVIDALLEDILVSCNVDTVINVIAPKELGKSVALIEVAKRIDQDKTTGFKVFYVNAAASIKRGMQRDYKISYPDEVSAMTNLFDNIQRYVDESIKIGERVLVIFDSPGGINGSNQAETDTILDSMITIMKEMVAQGSVTFYCIAAIPNNAFTAKRIAKLGRGRYVQYTEADWGIDLSLTENEMALLIDKFEKQNKAVFTEEQKAQIMIKKDSIGEYITQMSQINRQG